MALESRTKIKVMVRDNWTCARCFVSIPDTPRMALARASGGDLWGLLGNHMTVDHIVPLAKGGTNNQNNLTAMCYVCNSLKGSGTHRTNPPGSGNTKKNTKRTASRKRARQARAAEKAAQEISGS